MCPQCIETSVAQNVRFATAVLTHSAQVLTQDFAIFGLKSPFEGFQNPLFGFWEKCQNLIKTSITPNPRDVFVRLSHMA